MKCFSVLFFTATACLAADFATGQAARVIIGQTQFTRGEPGASATLLGGVSGVAYANDTLVVADSNRAGSEPNNNRVLIFRNVSGKLPGPTDELQYTQRCPICTGQADVVLGQTDFVKTEWHLAQDGLRLPTAVATDGQILVVADTDNNRVLIWNRIPTSNGQPADVVVGQPDFKSNKITPVSDKTMRGPQGVWLQNGRLYVADTQNHRVLIFNSIPTSNGAGANVVLGQPDMSTVVQQSDISQQPVDPHANNMLNPVSVTSDGVKLFVTDLGHNRVLVWNSIPNANFAPADVVIGQPDMTSAVSNNSFKVENETKIKVLCDSDGVDADNKPTFPVRCNATLSFPRFALSDGETLFIADGGNDRVLVFNQIPTENGATANNVIGQLGGLINQASDAADSMRTPMSMAWDGTNLYVSDAYNRRINVYSRGEHNIPYTGVRNAASLAIYAVGGVGFSGTIKEGDSATIKIKDKEYTYKIVKDDTFDKAIVAMVNLINAGEGDPNVLATPNLPASSLILTARAQGADGNLVEYSVSVSDNAEIQLTAAGANLDGGYDAAKIGPGTLVTIMGDKLADEIVSVPAGTDELPTDLGGVQVYFDGVRSPLYMVSPGQINAQIPYEFLDTTSVNAFVRTTHKDGTVTVTTPVAVSIVPQNPGIFAGAGNDPRPGLLLHSSSFATGTISLDGSVAVETAETGTLADEVLTVTIEDRTYTYTVKDGDSVEGVRNALIDLINQDPKVMAYPAGVFTRIRLRARVPGPEGNGIAFTATSADGASLTATATNSALCCANVENAPVTPDNPATPGETLIVLATGLGLPNVLDNVNTGKIFPRDGGLNQPREFLSALAGGKTANVLYAGLQPGTVGTWRVELELNSDIPTNPLTQLTIAQDVYVSNIVTFALVNPVPPSEATTTTAVNTSTRKSTVRRAVAKNKTSRGRR